MSAADELRRLSAFAAKKGLHHSAASLAAQAVERDERDTSSAVIARLKARIAELENSQ